MPFIRIHMPTPINLPCLLFKSAKPLNDYLAGDMRYGDLSETQLKEQFNLKRISARIDPYTQKRHNLNPHGAIANPTNCWR